MRIIKILLVICFFMNSLSSGVLFCRADSYSNPEERLSDTAKSNEPNLPNILLIGIETLRADHVSSLGYHRNTTPALDKLASQGVVFSRAIATSSWTLPSVMSVFTSLYPGIHQRTSYQKLTGPGVTLTEILKANGYKTAAFVSNPTLDSRYGFSKGFDLYDDFSVRMSIGLEIFDNEDVPGRGTNYIRTSEAVNYAALNWLKNNRQAPFFMFVFYFDPHYDYIPPPPFDTVFDPCYEGSVDGRKISHELRKSTRPPQRDLEHIIALYDGEILCTDGYISKLLDKFSEYGILDDTLIIVFGDHGDEFYEHGSTAHAHSLYNELIHIPLIFKWPQLIPQNRQVDSLVGQCDIMPTILDYLGIGYEGFLQGKSLRPLIEAQKDKLHDVVYAEVSLEKNKHFSAAISKDSKLIFNLSTDEKQFFDFSNDPNEQLNIYKEKTSIGASDLEKRLVSWLSNNKRLTSQPSSHEQLKEIELDEEHLRELKSLGYVQ